jgi:hypothetical protein
MLSYEKWKMLNESLGRTTLGLTQTPKIGGIISNIHVPQGQEANEGWEDNELDGEEEDMDDKGVDLGDYHDEVGHEDEEGSEEEMDSDDDMGDEDSMEDDDDMEEDDSDDMGDEEEVEEDDSDDMGDEDSMEDDDDMEKDDSDDMGDEEMEVDVVRKSAPSMGMGMGETKKKNGQILSESDWWSSVKGMIGQVQPNGAIKTEDSLPFGNYDDDKPSYTGAVKNVVDRFAKIHEKLETMSKSKNLDLMKDLVGDIVEVLHSEKGMSKGQIINKLKEIVNEMTSDQTAEPEM